MAMGDQMVRDHASGGTFGRVDIEARPDHRPRDTRTGQAQLGEARKHRCIIGQGRHQQDAIGAQGRHQSVEHIEPLLAARRNGFHDQMITQLPATRGGPDWMPLM